MKKRVKTIRSRPTKCAILATLIQRNENASGFCSIKENFEPPEEVRELIPVVPTGTHTDLYASFDSALKIKGLADICIPQHDPSLLDVKSIP